MKILQDVGLMALAIILWRLLFPLYIKSNFAKLRYSWTLVPERKRKVFYNMEMVLIFASWAFSYALKQLPWPEPYTFFETITSIFFLFNILIMPSVIASLDFIKLIRREAYG